MIRLANGGVGAEAFSDCRAWVAFGMGGLTGRRCSLGVVPRSSTRVTTVALVSRSGATVHYARPGGVAQGLEQSLHKRRVGGSIPPPATRSNKTESPSAEAVPADSGPALDAALNDGDCEIVARLALRQFPLRPRLKADERPRPLQ